VGDGRARPSGQLAALLRGHREAAGLTQGQLAGQAGVSVGALQDLEQGRTVRPRPRSLDRLALALRLRTDETEQLVRAAAAADAPAAAGAGPGLRLEVLGPLAVWRDGLPVRLGPARQRAVLGLLAMEAGASLPRTAIADALWGDDPPATSATMIQAQVSRVRQLLGARRGPGGRAWVSWDGSAYQLNLDGVQLDLSEFRELADRARRVAAQNQATGCGLYQRALRLWRGQPLEGVEELRGHPAVVALARQRDDVVIEYAGVAAEAGRPGEVIGHLEALAAREPLDERAHARLITTLAATGRQAAALGVYENLAGRLDRELGVQPGPELAEAHLQVLRQQVPAAASAPARPGNGRGPGAAEPVVPRQLPGAVPRFAGRAAELAELTGRLDQVAGASDTVVISAIGGTAGVGKTALALHWAHQVADRFPDGQLHVNLRGFGPSGTPLTAAAAVRLFLDGLGVPPERIPAGLDAQSALYRSLLAGRRVLVVADNARDPEQVRPLLPGTPGCLVLVTSRNQLTGLAVADGAHLLILDALSAAECRELLAQRLGDERVAREPEAVAELTGLCARLPLALSIVAARAAARPRLALAALAGELRGAGARLDALGTADAATDVRTVFSWSVRHVSGPAARMFRLLGVHPGADISVPAAASLAGLPPGQARQALAELTRAHLVTEHVPGRYACHDLLRAYAAEQARAVDGDAVRHAALHRVLDHYLHTAYAGSLLLQFDRDPITIDPPQPRTRPEELAGRQQALGWFHAERQVLLAAVARAEDEGFGRHAWQLPWALATFLNWHGYWHDLTVTQESALAAAGRLGDRMGQAEARRYLGQVRARVGDHAAAGSHLTKALALYRDLGNQALQARVQLDLGHARQLHGRDADALGHAEQSLRLYRLAGHRVGEANALNAVGWLHAQLGALPQALGYCELALTAYRELGNRTGEAVALDSLGYVHYRLDHHAEAMACYQQALEILGDADDLHLRAEMLTRLGDAHRSIADDAAARRAWHEALAILDNLNHPDAAGVRSRLSQYETGNGSRRAGKARRGNVRQRSA
jgi:DNA-binding SARP family transcriptional activator/tetratricopeptide (TPR) repeat protein